VTTKSGSNQWHGSLFEFFRNTDLDATRYFFTSKQQFNLNQFGGSIGGPIQKDKTFFFLDYQAKMQREGVPFTGFVPTTAMTTPDAFGNYNLTTNPFLLTSLNNPYATGTEPTTFLCSNATTPEPVLADGSQAPGGHPCDIIPAALINPIGAKVVQLYPAPNSWSWRQCWLQL